MARSTVETLASDIRDILEEYGNETTQLTKDVVKAIGKKGVEALKSNASVFVGTGTYKRGWRCKVDESRLGAKATLHNARVPGLPHLLEHGHAKRGGGRVEGTVHIKPVEDELDKVFEEELKRRL